MAKYRVEAIEERADGQIAIDTFVVNDEGVDIGHFTVILYADAVLALAGLSLPERKAGYKALFQADTRITKTVDSENAATQMNADLTLPLEVDL
jgi:hypothetical protein